MFSQKAAPFYITTIKERGFQFLHLLLSITFILAILVSVCEVVCHCGLFGFFFFWLHHTARRDLSSLTRDRTRALSSESAES